MQCAVKPFMLAAYVKVALLGDKVFQARVKYGQIRVPKSISLFILHLKVLLMKIYASVTE
jgi:hypothetical protein